MDQSQRFVKHGYFLICNKSNTKLKRPSIQLLFIVLNTFWLHQYCYWLNELCNANNFIIEIHFLKQQSEGKHKICNYALLLCSNKSRKLPEFKGIKRHGKFESVFPKKCNMAYFFKTVHFLPAWLPKKFLTTYYVNVVTFKYSSADWVLVLDISKILIFIRTTSHNRPLQTCFKQQLLQISINNIFDMIKIIFSPDIKNTLQLLGIQFFKTMHIVHLNSSDQINFLFGTFFFALSSSWTGAWNQKHWFEIIHTNEINNNNLL